VVGQLMVKKGLNLLGAIDFSQGKMYSYFKIFASPFVILGSLSYAISIFFWLYALTRVDLSFAYPFLALSYVLIILASWLFLDESIPATRWIGILVICLGVFLVSRA
jgi:drug/metabolite transporter (DMT)-like permease